MEMYKKLFSVNPYPCFIFNEEGKVLDLNEAGVEFLNDWNNDKDQLDEKNLRVLIHQHTLNLQNLEIFANDKYYRFEVSRINEDTLTFYGYNVTHQKNIADTLFNLVDDINEGLFLVDISQQGKIIEVNGTATRYLGHTREELLTMKLGDFIEDFSLKTQEDWDHHTEIMKKAQSITNNDIYCVRKDGTPFPVEMVTMIKQVMESDYQLTLVRDITERLEQDKMKEEMKINMFATGRLSHLGEMATNLSHEISNPLTVISAKTFNIRKMITTNKLDESKTMKAMKIVESSVQKITNVIESLRNISKSLEKNSLANQKIYEIVTDVINLYTERFKVLKIKYETEGLDTLKKLDVYCNRAEISQALISLIHNSYEALEKVEGERWLKVSAVKVDDSVEIRVTDCGHGIDDDIRPRIFDSFYSSKSFGNAIGLGLTLSLKTLQQHDGDLFYDESSPNTCFVIKLPISEPK